MPLSHSLSLTLTHSHSLLHSLLHSLSLTPSLTHANTHPRKHPLTHTHTLSLFSLSLSLSLSLWLRRPLSLSVSQRPSLCVQKQIQACHVVLSCSVAWLVSVRPSNLLCNSLLARCDLNEPRLNRAKVHEDGCAVECQQDVTGLHVAVTQWLHLHMRENATEGVGVEPLRERWREMKRGGER